MSGFQTPKEIHKSPIVIHDLTVFFMVMMPNFKMSEWKPKHKICVDENISKLADELNFLGYKAFCYPEGLKDNDIHKLLNKQKISIFITQNCKRYAYIQNSKYKVIGLSIDLIENNAMNVVAKAINCYLNAQLKYGKGYVGLNIELNSMQLYSMGCRQVKKVN